MEMQDQANFTNSRNCVVMGNMCNDHIFMGMMIVLFGYLSIVAVYTVCCKPTRFDKLLAVGEDIEMVGVGRRVNIV